MIKKGCLKLLILTIAVLFSACQSTPDDTFVINKNDDTMQNVINQTAISSAKNQETILASDTWNEEMKNDDLNKFVQINANITVPNTNKYAVIEVKPGKFDQAQVDSLVNYFSQGNILYDKDASLTRTEIEQRIIEAKSDLVLAQNGDKDMPSTDEIQLMIDDLEKQYEKAPEDAANVDSTLKIQADNQQETLDVCFNLGKEKLARISVFNCNEVDYTSLFSYEVGNLYSPIGNLYGSDANGLTMTLEKAKQEAQKLMDKLGLNNFKFSVAQTGVNKSNVEEQGYNIRYTQIFNNIPISYSKCIKPTNNSIDENTGDLINSETGDVIDFAPKWGASYIKIQVDDTGVTSFAWMNPIEVKKTLNDDVELLDFEKIQSIFRQQMKLNYINLNKKNHLIFHITNIELGMVHIAEKDKIGYYLLVPAWTFYGSYEDPSLSPNTDLNYLLRTGTNDIQTSLLVINAIDGTVIGS